MLLQRFQSRILSLRAEVLRPGEAIALAIESNNLDKSSEISDESAPDYWAEDLSDQDFRHVPRIEEGISHVRGVGRPISRVSETSEPSSICVGAAIIITSAIFASLHAGQWPAPIPIFILAIGLGVIYQRTGSLIATICMHAVFNGISTLMLFFALVSGAAAEAEKKIPPPAIEKVTPVQKVESVASDVDRRPH